MLEMNLDGLRRIAGSIQKTKVVVICIKDIAIFGVADRSRVKTYAQVSHKV